jgi:hypothetical protein
LPPYLLLIFIYFIIKLDILIIIDINFVVALREVLLFKSQAWEDADADAFDAGNLANGLGLSMLDVIGAFGGRVT